MRLRILLLLLVAALVACGGEKEAEVTSANIDTARNTSPTSVNNNAASVDSTSPLAGLSQPEPDALTLPDVPELTGTVYFTSGTTLYQAQFDGQPATPLVTDISSATVEINPRYLAYTSPGERRLRMIQTDLETHQSVELTTIGGKLRQVRGHIWGWSPDNEWALVVDVLGQRWVVVNHDATIAYEVGNASTGVWLSDNRLLLMELNPPFSQLGFTTIPDEGQQVVGLSILDPVSGETSALNLSPEVMSAAYDYLGLIEALPSVGLSLAPVPDLTGYVAQVDGAWWAVQLPRDVLAFQPHPCDTWSIASVTEGADPQTVYQATDVVWISDLTPLSDGSVLFLEWAYVACDIQGTMTVRLLQWLPTGEVMEVTPAVSPIEEGRNNLSLMIFTQSRRFAVSPDEQYVLWPAGGLESGVAELRVTELSTGVTATVIAAGLRRDSNAYLDTAMFSAVFWVP